MNPSQCGRTVHGSGTNPRTKHSAKCRRYIDNLRNIVYNIRKYCGIGVGYENMQRISC